MPWNEFYDSVKKTAGKAADKINQAADVATLQVKLSLAEHKLEEAYAAFGKAAYAHFSSDDNGTDAIAAAMPAVEAALKTVRELSAQLEKAKKE